MKEGLTELAFIIDRSGSMEGLESDTSGGFNTILKGQQAVEGGVLYISGEIPPNELCLRSDSIDILNEWGIFCERFSSIK